MPARILNGTVLAEAIKGEIARAAAQMRETGRPVHLVAVHVGSDEPSILYARRQEAACREVGIDYSLDLLDAASSQEDVVARIRERCADDGVSGVIFLMPAPARMDPDAVQAAIEPDKDVEGMNPANLGLLLASRKGLAPCTPLGAVELLKSCGVPLQDKHAVVVGASNIVGKPLALLLMGETASVTVCRTSEKELPSRTRRADVLIAATGKPGLITADMVKPGAIVIDVGINLVPALDELGRPVLGKGGKQKMKTVGDVDFEAVSQVAAVLSPVPGGTGPMTVAMLLRNTLEAATRD